MDEILGIARRHGASAWSRTPHRRSVPSTAAVRWARLEIFGTVSFYPSKNLGGSATRAWSSPTTPTSPPARLLRNHGAERQYFGGNFRLDAVQAALLSVKLPLLGEYTAR